MRTLKNIFSVTFTMLVSFGASGQVYKQGVGLQLDVVSFKESYTSVTGLSLPVRNTAVPGILYKGSLGFALSHNTTLSITTYPFIGLGPKDAGKPKIVAEIPLLAEVFFGDVDYFGGFIGLGASYTYTTIPGFGDGTVFGPQIEGGLQFPLNDMVLAAKLSYTYGLNDPSISAYPERTYSKAERGIFAIGLTYMFVY